MKVLKFFIFCLNLLFPNSSMKITFCLSDSRIWEFLQYSEWNLMEYRKLKYLEFILMNTLEWLMKLTILWCNAVNSRSVTFLLWASRLRCLNWLYLHANITPGMTRASNGDLLPKNAISLTFATLKLSLTSKPFTELEIFFNRFLLFPFQSLNHFSRFLSSSLDTSLRRFALQSKEKKLLLFLTVTSEQSQRGCDLKMEIKSG